MRAHAEGKNMNSDCIAGPYDIRFSCARDFFEAVRDASKDLDSMDSRLAALRAQTGLHAIRYDTPHVRGGQHDANAASDRFMELERRFAKRRAEDRRMVDLAMDMLYGCERTGSAGLSALLDIRHADLLAMRYIYHETWPDVAAGTGMSERWCQNEIAPAFETIDAYGMQRVIDGLGLAEPDA